LQNNILYVQINEYCSYGKNKAFREKKVMKSKLIDEGDVEILLNSHSFLSSGFPEDMDQAALATGLWIVER
jgi:predicted type IV restriction endonuclease